MTINDLINNGIELQGGVTIKTWNEENEILKTLYSTNNFLPWNVSENIKNLNIKHMYAESEYARFIIIEVDQSK